MKTTWLQAEKDPMGAAIYDYFKNGKAGKLRVFSSQFEEDEIPVSELFRTYEYMPLLEQTALDMAQGKSFLITCLGEYLQEKVQFIHYIHAFFRINTQKSKNLCMIFKIYPYFCSRKRIIIQ